MRAPEGQQRHELRDRFALHVERAPTPDVTVLDQPAERIHAPVLGRGEHHVHVVQQNDGTRAAITGQPRVQVGLAGSRLEDARLDAVALQHLRQPARRRDLVARWVGRVDAEVLREQRDRFITERFPITFRWRGNDHCARGGLEHRRRGGTCERRHRAMRARRGADQRHHKESRAHALV